MNSAIELQPLWDTTFNMQLGYKHNIGVYRVVLMMNQTGICVFNSTEDEFSLNANNISDFSHWAF